MAKIIISRTSAFSHRFRPFEVFIDGERVGLIKNGSTEEFNTTSGFHKVHCKMSWYYSEAFNITMGADEVKYLKVGVTQKFLGLIYAILGMSLLISIIFRSASWYDNAIFNNICSAALVIIITHGLYYSIVARKRYLQVSEDSDNIFNR